MSKACDIKNTKDHFVDKGLIDVNFNIRANKLNDFRNENVRLGNYARRVYRMNNSFGNPMTETPMTGKKAFLNKVEINEQFFTELDRLKNFTRDINYYNGDQPLMDQEELYQNTNLSYEQPDKELNSKLQSFLERIGVKYEALDKIIDKNGNPLTAIAKADLLNKVIQVVEGKADITTLPEEASHFFVRVLGKEHPLIKSMMKDVVNFDEYAEVVNSEFYQEQYKGNEDSLREEAIGKVLAKFIIGEFKGNKTQENRIEGFWKTLWNKLKSIFTGIKSNEIEQEISVWNQAAKQILSNDVEINNEIPFSEEEQELFQADLTQDEVVNNLMSKKITMDKITHKYTVNGKELAKSVTDLVKSFYWKKFRDPNKEESAESIVFKKKGTAIHEFNRYIVEELINNRVPTREGAEKYAQELLKEPDFKDDNTSFFNLTDAQFEVLHTNMKLLVDSARKIDPKVKFFTEFSIVDESKSTGGTLDLLLVFSDGTVSIYDYKGIKIDKQKEFWGIPEWKEEGWDIQLSEYKRILKDRYGVTKFKETRVVPIGFNERYSEGKLEGGFYQIKMDITGKTNKYLRMMPLANEMKGKTSIDNIISRLLEQRVLYKNKLSKNLDEATRERYKADLERTNEILKRLQLFEDVQYMLDRVQYYLDNILLKIENNNEEYVETPELNEFKSFAKVYEDIIKESKVKLKDLNKDSEEYKTLKENISTTLDRLDDAVREVNNLLSERVNDTLDVNSFKNSKKITWWQGLFSTLNEIDNPAIKALAKLINKANAGKFEELERITKDFTEIHNNLVTWAKNKGISEYDAFRKIINPETKNLITEFTSESYKTLKNRQKESDIKWLKDNITFDKTAFQEYKAKRILQINKTYSDPELKDQKDKAIEMLDVMYNAETSEKALTNSKNWFIKPKESKENINPNWSYINEASNKPLLDYYNKYVELMVYYDSILPIKLKKNFVANIRKDIIDNFGETGKIGNIKNYIINALEIREEDSEKGSSKVVDPLTGEIIFSIPVLYTDKLKSNITPSQLKTIKEELKKKYTEGSTEYNLNLEYEINKQEYSNGLESKSIDLTRSMLLFSEAVMTHKYMAEIEDEVKALRNVITSSDYTEDMVDENNKPIRNKITNIILKRLNISPETLQVFDKFVNLYVYGQRDQGKELFGTIKTGVRVDSEGNITSEGREISSNKIVRKVMQYFSLKTLGLNPLLAGQNLMGTKANLYMKANEGIYFNQKQLNHSHILFARRDPAYFMPIEYFKIHTYNYTQMKANNLSASKVAKTITLDNMYILHRKPDSAVDNNILISMMQNYGVDSNGDVKRLSKLPEGSKSLLELGKIENDIYSIEGLSEEGFQNFRRKVKKIAERIKGNMSEEDMNLVGTTMIGQALMQFRNWMPGLVKERFSSLHYDEVLDEFDVGRFNVFMSGFMKQGFLPTAKEFLKLFGDATTMGLFKWTGLRDSTFNNSLAKYQYDKFMSENPSANFTFDEFVELKKAKLRSLATELRIYLSFLALLGFLISGSGDDEDKKPRYSKTWFGRQFYAMAVRGEREVAFFFNLSTVMDIVKSPFAVQGVVNNLYNVARNGIDESGDVFLESTDNRDKSPMFYYTSKLLPVANPWTDITEIFGKQSTTLRW